MAAGYLFQVARLRAAMKRALPVVAGVKTWRETSGPPTQVARMDRLVPEVSERSRFERLVMPHRNAAFNLAFWMLRNRDEAEDVVQEAYLRAFRAFPAFRGDAFKAWLLAIVRNTSLTALQARKRAESLIRPSGEFDAREDFEMREHASDDPSPEALVIAEDDRKHLMAALEQLPLNYRDILNLREMEGLSYDEIAEIVGIPIGTVMSRLSRGRAELRKALAHLADDPAASGPRPAAPP
jgi:RNA polymerase sigma-70 factor, ECF subfamily